MENSVSTGGRLETMLLPLLPVLPLPLWTVLGANYAVETYLFEMKLKMDWFVTLCREERRFLEGGGRNLEGEETTGVNKKGRERSCHIKIGDDRHDILLGVGMCRFILWVFC